MKDTQASTDVLAGPLSLHTSEQLPFYCSAVRNDEGRAKPQLRGCSQGLSEMKMLGSQRRVGSRLTSPYPLILLLSTRAADFKI